MKENTKHEKMHVHCLAMRRLNSMESRLSIFTLTKICLLVIFFSGSLVQTKKNNLNEFQSKSSKISSSNLKSESETSLPTQFLREDVILNKESTKKMVCGSKWIKNLLERNLPQRLLPLSNGDINNLLWDIVDVLSYSYNGSIHSEDANIGVSYYLDTYGYWSKPTKYKPDHEIYDEIWNSFTWKDPTKGFANSKDALKFIKQIHLALQSSRRNVELTMLMDFFDQPLYFNNNPRLKSFPPTKTGYTFLNNLKLPAKIRSRIPRGMSVVKAIEEAQDMVSFNRKELKYNLRVLNVRTLNLRLINRRCQSFRTTTPATKKIVCGDPVPKSKIVGGKVSKQGSWPWVAYIRFSVLNNFDYCGGALISDKHILTAAHCTFGKPIENVRVYLGENDLNELEYSSIEYEAEKVFSHEDFNRREEAEHDIALIKLKGKVIFNNDRRPICLPPPNITLGGKYAYLAGWGDTAWEGQSSQVLLEAIMPIWENAKCKKVMGDTITEQTLCVGGDSGVGQCQGDSGGPVMYQISFGRWMVVGIISWGGECGRQGSPGVSTRVSTYLDWINAKLKL